MNRRHGIPERLRPCAVAAGGARSSGVDANERRSECDVVRVFVIATVPLSGVDELLEAIDGAGLRDTRVEIGDSGRCGQLMTPTLASAIDSQRHVSAGERAILAYLVRGPRGPASASEIAVQALGRPDGAAELLVRQYIFRLRRWLAPRHAIEHVRGQGYCLRCRHESSPDRPNDSPASPI